MKSQFSTAWIGSSQPRKQRKYRYEAPLHIKHKFLSAPLSKELRTKYKTRSLPVRVGDEVLVMRGAFAKKKGKVAKVYLKKTRVTVEGITRKKIDGSKLNVYIDPSKLQITTLKTDDKRRLYSGEAKDAQNKK
ncbi:MAG: 50S ribosomal protein L24 [Nanoarchaeota archaeon]